MKLQTLLSGTLALGALCAPVLLTPSLVQLQAQSQTQALPFLHPLFSDDAVLQRDRVIPVWGWAKPGTRVTVKVDEKSSEAIADVTGRWSTNIGPYKAGGPHTLTLSGADPAEAITRKNILFGDVWLCSGQSNMEQGISAANDPEKEVAAANYPNIRLFSVPNKVADTPQKTVDAQWLPCTPQNIAAGGWGGFSAVGYFFGRKLNQELGVPIGLIDATWGGTVAEAWTSESGLAKLPDFAAEIENLKKSAINPEVPKELQTPVWLVANDAGAAGNWSAADYNDQSWANIKTPGAWESASLPVFSGLDGLVWYRKVVDVPTDWAGKDLTLRLGPIDDADTTYWNGTVVGNNDGWTIQRSYTIPGAQVKAGRNVIAVRVIDTGGGGGLVGTPEDMSLQLDATKSLPLAGDWKINLGKKMIQDNPNRVTVLSNAMIAPLEPYGLKGAIWYQGEANAGRGEQYSRLLPAMIEDWRTRFKTPLSFYIVQLAGYMAPDETPHDDAWPRLRDAQLHTAQNVKGTGIAITTDIGEQNDIHPKNKQDVGLRLALNALAKDYSKKVEYSGPTPQAVKADNSQLVLNFDHAAGGLTIKGEANRVFAIAGADQKWYWATPQIQDTRVILTAPEVTEPVAARYAWSNMPRATLYNGAGLPASPFKTDSW